LHACGRTSIGLHTSLSWLRRKRQLGWASLPWQRQRCHIEDAEVAGFVEHDQRDVNEEEDAFDERKMVYGDVL
jgi:hypothetical protein